MSKNKFENVRKEIKENEDNIYTPPKRKRETKVVDKTKMVRIDEADHEWLKETAYLERISIKDLVTKVINDFKE